MNVYVFCLSSSLQRLREAYAPAVPANVKNRCFVVCFENDLLFLVLFFVGLYVRCVCRHSRRD